MNSTPVDPDPLCSCNHLAAKPAHTLARHTPACTGADSYGLPCECPSFQLAGFYREDGEGAAHETGGI